MSDAGAPEGDYLPDPHLLRIDDSKVTEYLLNITHAKGGAKASFFLSVGFSLDKIEEFKAALREHAAQNKIAKVEPHPYGQKSVVDCSLATPSGAKPCVRVVWNDHADGAPPRLITAHPLA
ncbi:MAG: hypothetical protein JO127_09655 [Caulobacteraceae bacterium]|nr:hypothetical protein [Caulobacteraceae bacterium]